ncbi:hypothetical protein M758_5G181700 [Ceratodon purpureus]|nr:hypothetical protein M758_5G181700 [Ceratodon purpureus]
MSSLLGLEGRERRLFLSKFSDSSAGCTKKQAPTGIAGEVLGLWVWQGFRLMLDH